MLRHSHSQFLQVEANAANLLIMDSSAQIEAKHLLEIGESSMSSSSTIESSIELLNDCFSIYVCSECMSRYLASENQENLTSIRCPEPSCEGVLEPRFCYSSLPSQGLFDHSDNALSQALIACSRRFECPFEDCSGILVDDDGEEGIKESECPYCHRLFCAQCKVPWHSDIECEEFQISNGREEIMALELSKRSECQGENHLCKFVVESSEISLRTICRGCNKKDTISIKESAEDREFFNLIKASMPQTKRVVDVSQEDGELTLLKEIKPSIATLRNRPLSPLSVIATGESSKSKDSSFICEICAEPKSQNESFSIEGCTHICSECMVKYVASKIQENITLIHCPGPGCEDGEVTLLKEIKPSVATLRNRPLSPLSVIAIGESSKPKDSSFICEICAEPKSENESFSIKGCTHYFCSECMVKYVASKIQENITLIHCPEPGCEGVLEPQFCRSILPLEVFDRWVDALCEAFILGSQKFYCPYEDCSAPLMDDGGIVIEESECPHCHRLFCVQCNVPWHPGIECGEFQKLNENERGRDDIMVMELAKECKWQRCPVCRFYVERSDGCLYMKCRCGFAFCYNCAAPVTDHYCNNCKS